MKLFEQGRFSNNFKYSMLKENESKHWTKQDRKLWTICLFILTSVLFAARVAMPVCATTISQEYGWNKADLGAVMGSFFWGYLSTQVLGGYIADRIGGDKVLLFSVIIWASLTIITPISAQHHSEYVSTLVLLTIIRVLLGLSQGVHYPSMMSLLSRKIPETERSFPSGVITSAANFGSVLCGYIGSIILEHRGWQEVFYVIGVTALVCTYLLYSLINKVQNNVISMARMTDVPSADTNKDSVPWKTILTKAPVWSIVICQMCTSNSFYILLSWLPTYFHDTFPNEKGYIYNTIPWVMSVPASILSGWMCEKLIQRKCSVGFTRKLMEVIALLGSSICGVMLPFCSNFSSAVICATGAVSAQTFHNNGVLINPQDIAPTFAGSVFGVMNSFGALQGFIGIYMCGYVLNLNNNWISVFSVMGVINVLGLCTFLFAGTGERVI